MFEKLKYRLFGLALALSPAALLAQESGAKTPIEIDSAMSSIDFASLFSALGGMIATAMIAALSLGAGVWGVLWLWRKVKSAAY